MRIVITFLDRTEKIFEHVYWFSGFLTDKYNEHFGEYLTMEIALHTKHGRIHIPRKDILYFYCVED